MTRQIKIDALPVFDAAQYLDNEEAIAAYLTGILEANDTGLLVAALGEIARARGMSEIAKSAGIARESLYKALRPGSAPCFDRRRASVLRSLVTKSALGLATQSILQELFV